MKVKLRGLVSVDIYDIIKEIDLPEDEVKRIIDLQNSSQWDKVDNSLLNFGLEVMKDRIKYGLFEVGDYEFYLEKMENED